MKLETLTSCNVCNSNRLKSIDPDCKICKCISCRYIFSSPRPTFDEIERFYSKQNKYDSWLAEERERDFMWIKRLKKMKQTIKVGTLLDVGTGIGQFLQHAKEHYTQVYGTEISESAICIAKNKYNLYIIKGDLMNIQFIGIAHFDNITLFHVLEHVSDPKKLIERCWSLLCKDGVLVIAVPNEILSLKLAWIRLKMRVRQLLKMRMEGYREINIGILGLRKVTMDNTSDEIHLSHFTPNVLKQLLESSGFYIVENSLDPINMERGIKYICNEFCYIICSFLMFVFGVNIYDTIWMTAKKKS